MDTGRVNPLAAHYSRFRVAERLLLTGHSHQAWPDVSYRAQQQAWLDAAEWVDDKWSPAAAKADQARAHWRRLLGTAAGDVALGQNTFELVARLLSALDLAARPKLITTDGEFHSITRLLARLQEAGLPVEVVAARPAETLAARLAAAVDDHSAAVLVSSVLFETAEIVPNLGELAQACERRGCVLLVDAYHHLNVVPFDLSAMGLERAFVTGGGYKYCQLGEGNAFLWVPAECRLRPILTGWYAAFSGLSGSGWPGEVRYGEGAARFDGATYDPTAHYRAVAVFEFHVDHGLTPEVLRDISQRQVQRLQRNIEALDLDPDLASVVALPAGRRAGFLALRVPRAVTLAERLRGRGLRCDARGAMLRLGPAPYLSDAQLDQAVELFAEAAGKL